jgi:hypothetical protein
MNLLALANRLKRKCKVTGRALTSVTGQVEDYAALIDFINEAWMDIQLVREDWMWMRNSASCATVAGKATYAPAADFLLSDFGNWAVNSFRNYVTANGVASEIQTDYIDYEQWRANYQFGATRLTQSRPIEITVTPKFEIGCGPVPADGYTITGDYYRVAAEMVDAGDIPSIPTQYHMIIVYRAMMYYGAAEAATEVYQEGAAEFKRFMNLLVMNQTDDFTTGGALA